VFSPTPFSKPKTPPNKLFQKCLHQKLLSGFIEKRKLSENVSQNQTSSEIVMQLSQQFSHFVKVFNDSEKFSNSPNKKTAPILVKNSTACLYKLCVLEMKSFAATSRPNLQPTKEGKRKFVRKIASEKLISKKRCSVYANYRKIYFSLSLSSNHAYTRH
jgi:hypothetical protein